MNTPSILKNRKTPIIYGVIGSIISVLMIIYSNNYADNNLTNILMPVLFLLLGFFTASQVISYAIIIEVNPPEYCAFSESIASTIIMTTMVMAMQHVMTATMPIQRFTPVPRNFVTAQTMIVTMKSMRIKSSMAHSSGRELVTAMILKFFAPLQEPR